jgi:hypothetical protein
MRREWRNVLVAFILFPLGAVASAALQESVEHGSGSGAELVRLTLDVSWGMTQTGVSVPARAPDGAAFQQTTPGIVLEMTEGQVIDGVQWPPGDSQAGTGSTASPGENGPGRSSKGSWRLGNTPEGRARVRVEAPLDAGMVVRGGDQMVNLPLLAILDRPQQTPQQSPLVVRVRRLPWDSLAVDLGEPASEGIVAPGTVFPVSVAYNILWPDSAEVAVHTTAALRSIRGGDDLSTYETRDREVMPTNRRSPPVRTFGLTAPRAEGTYVLEVRASWEAHGSREGSRLGRLIRRHRTAGGTSSAVRRVLFTVINRGASLPAMTRDGYGRETEVDAIDLTRSRSYRPLATGRSPLLDAGRLAWPVPSQALIEPSRRDRLRGWIMRTGLEAAKLDPADASGVAWTAVGLKVSHPERPHRLTLKVKGGEPAALGVALIEPGGASRGASPRLVLDACAAGPPILEDGPPAAFNWLVWPDAAELVLVLLNRSPESEVRLGAVTLTELEDLPTAPIASQPESTAARTFGLYLSGTHALEPFGANSSSGDSLTIAQNLVRYLGYCGASAVVLPEDLADRSVRRSLDGQAAEDSTGPDHLEVVRRVLARQRISLWLELSFEGSGALPGLPRVDSPEAAQRGLVRIDRQGRPDGPTYHPLHPDVRAAMKRRVVQALQQTRADTGESANRAGLIIRLGPGPTLLGTPDTGLDDATFDRFVHESFSPETARGIPGLGGTDPDRFTVRSRYLAGVGRMPWLAWRSRAIASLYSELAEAAQAVAPGTMLAVVTPSLSDGPAGIEARRVDRAGLAPSQAWRSVGLDLQAWPSSRGAPPVFRGIALSRDALAHDLATSPDLDALVAGQSQRGLLLSIDGGPQSFPGQNGSSPLADALPDPSTAAVPGAYFSVSDSSRSGRSGLGVVAGNGGSRGNDQTICLTALPLGDGPAADEPLEHALAALDARWVFLAGNAAAGQEERLRRFAAVLRALPAWPAVPLAAHAQSNPKPFGVAVRRMFDDSQTFLAIANDSPYPIRLAGVLDAPTSAAIEDLGRGLRLAPAQEAGARNLVLDLLPYGIAAIRIGAPRAGLSSVTPYPSEAVMATMQARFNEFSALLARLNHGVAAASVEPSNPGFEPEQGPPVRSSVPTASKVSASPAPGPGASVSAAAVGHGWRLEANPVSSSTIAIDTENPYQGQGSLRLTAAVVPASVVSEAFAPDFQSSLEIQVYLRASAPEARVRVWIEGESGGQPFVRRTELGVRSDWEARVVRVSDVPAAGLDTARLRFELLTPGSLWIDDLQLRAESSSRSARLNAQITLLAALQAYREQRFGDFTRLAASHWIRQSSTAATARLARANTIAPKERVRTNRSTGAASSALPSERKLR